MRKQSRKVRWAAMTALLGICSQSQAVLTKVDGGNWDTVARQTSANNSMDAVLARFNAYAVFDGSDIDETVGFKYNSAVPTAQCAWNGQIEYGGTYPNERVTQHELNHYLGSNYGHSVTGPRAVALLQQFDGIGSTFNTDGTHFWNYGLNYDSEWSIVNSWRNVAIMYAFRGDWGIGSTANPTAWAATTVTMTASDALGTSAFNYYSTWSDNTFAHSNAAYSTGDFTIRTPASANAFKFAGASLTINNTTGINGGLLFKGTGTTGYVQIDNLILAGGYVRHGTTGSDLFQLNGKVTVTAPSTIHADQGPIKINSAIGGTAPLTILADADGHFVTFTSSQNSNTANLNVGGRWELAPFANQKFVIGANGVNNVVTGAASQVKINGMFDLDLSGATEQIGNAWTLVNTTNTTYGDLFQVNGFNFDAGVARNAAGFVFTPTTGQLTYSAQPTSVTWNGSSSSSWNNNANWSSAPASGNTIVFGPAGVSGTALVNNRTTPGAFNAAGLIFASNAPAYTLNPGVAGSNGVSLTQGIINRSANLQTINDGLAVAFKRTNVITNSGGGNVVINSNISGAGGIAKLGLGTLTLTGANTYSGGTRVDEGTLVLTGSLNSAGALQVGGGTFSSARSGTQTVNGLSVLPGVSKVNNTVAGSTLALGAITRYAGGVVGFDDTTGSITTTTANTNNILGPWAIVGTGANARFAANSANVVTPFTAGTASTTFGYTDDPAANYDVSGIGGPFGVQRDANTVRYTGPAGSLLSNTTQTFSFNALMNAGTGTLTIGGGSFILHAAAGSTGELVVAPMSGGITFANPISNGSNGTTLIIAGTETVTLSATNVYSGRTRIGGGATLATTVGTAIPDASIVTVGDDSTLSATLSETIGGLEGTGNVIVGTSQTLTIGAANLNTIFSGVISGTSAALTKTGSGIQYLSGTNTYSGNTSVSNGAISVSSIASLGTGSTINLGSGSGVGVLQYTGAGETTSKSIFLSAGAAANGGTIDMVGTGLLRFTGATLAANATQLHTLTLQGSTSGTGQIDGVISDGSSTNKTSLLKQGTGQWILTGNNTYTGTTTINAGTLQIGTGGTSGSLSSSSTITNNGTLAFNRSDTLTQGTNFANAITGTGGVAQIGSGTTILASANTYTGPTLISAGTLQIGNGGTAGSLSPSSALTTNGTFAVKRSNAVVQGIDFASTIAGTGGISQRGTGTTTLNGANTYTGTTAVTAGVLEVAGSHNSNHGAYNVTGGTLRITGLVSTSGTPAPLGVTGSGLANIDAGNATFSSVNATNLTIQNNGKLTLAASAGPVTTASEVTTLSIQTGGKLDLKNNAVIVHSTDTTNTARNARWAQVASGQNNFDNNGQVTWDGAGIVSSTARASNIGLGVDVYVVGVASNHDLTALAADGGAAAPYDAGNPWLGTISTVGANDVLIRMTYAGDTNLDGTVTIDDYNNIDGTFSGLLPTNFGWVSGDFDFNGVITIDDYNAIDTGYLYQGGQLTQSMIASRTAMFGAEYVTHLEQVAAGFAAVPEPASFAVFGLGAMRLLRRRGTSK